jgi:hypothetical protein
LPVLCATAVLTSGITVVGSGTKPTALRLSAVAPPVGEMAHSMKVRIARAVSEVVIFDGLMIRYSKLTIGYAWAPVS